jgi:hypothetical protein
MCTYPSRRRNAGFLPDVVDLRDVDGERGREPGLVENMSTNDALLAYCGRIRFDDRELRSLIPIARERSPPFLRPRSDGSGCRRPCPA